MISIMVVTFWHDLMHNLGIWWAVGEDTAALIISMFLMMGVGMAALMVTRTEKAMLALIAIELSMTFLLTFGFGWIDYVTFLIFAALYLVGGALLARDIGGKGS